MIENKVVLKKEFEKDVVDAISRGKYDLLEVRRDKDNSSEATEVSGLAKTENFGSVEFSFKTERVLRPHEVFKKVGCTCSYQ